MKEMKTFERGGKEEISRKKIFEIVGGKDFLKRPS